MIRYDRIVIAVKNGVHRLDLHRTAIALEDIVDTLGRAVFPSVDLTAMAGFAKAVRVQFAVLVHVHGIAYDAVIGLLSGRRIEIAGQ